MNFRHIKIPYFLVLAFFVSGCSSTVHKDFIESLVKDSRNNDGSFKSTVVSLAYNDWGKYLAVGHESGSIDIWDAKQRASKREIKAHDYRANLLAFTSDGSSFFSNSYFEQSTKLWSATTGELLHSISDTRGPVCPTLDKHIFLVGQSARFRMFDLERKMLLPEKYETSGVILVMTMDVASQQIAIGTASGSIEIWKYLRNDGNPSFRRMLTSKPYDTGNWVVGLQFSTDGTTLYSAARSGVVDGWNTRSLEKQRAIPTTLKYIHSVANIEGKGLLVLGGTTDPQGLSGGFVEVVDLGPGTSTIYPVNTSLPVVAFIPPLAALITAQSRSIKVDTLSVND